jgi:hypothetical protein
MPRTCTVCTHPERAALDKCLVANESNRAVSIRFGTSVAALQRHRANHLPKVLARAQRTAQERHEAAHAGAVAAVAQEREQKEQAHALDVIQQLRVINQVSVAILHEARQAADAETALKAIDRIQRQIELQGRLLGQLAENQTANVHLTRIEQMLSVSVPVEQVPVHLRHAVLDGQRHE